MPSDSNKKFLGLFTVEIGIYKANSISIEDPVELLGHFPYITLAFV